MPPCPRCKRTSTVRQQVYKLGKFVCTSCRGFRSELVLGKPKKNKTARGEPSSLRGALVDPLSRIMQQVSAAPDLRALRRAIHPESLFADFGSVQHATEWTLRMLRGITGSTRAHYQFGSTPCSICHLVPAPFRIALQAVALHEGWPVEFLLLAVCSNVGWLEHVETRLRVRMDEQHERTPNIPLMVESNTISVRFPGHLAWLSLRSVDPRREPRALASLPVEAGLKGKIHVVLVLIA